MHGRYLCALAGPGSPDLETNQYQITLNGAKQYQLTKTACWDVDLSSQRALARGDVAVQRRGPASFDWAKIRSSLEGRVSILPDSSSLLSLSPV
ncbi:hypothetical protein AOLI_G00099500 [Acnodon oligacanthus]